MKKSSIAKKRQRIFPKMKELAAPAKVKQVMSTFSDQIEQMNTMMEEGEIEEEEDNILDKAYSMEL